VRPAHRVTWDSPPAEPPDPSIQQGEKRTEPGQTKKGLPLSERGGFVLDAAAIKSDDDPPLAVLDVVACVPVSPSVFFDARLPVGLGVVGNAMVGGHFIGHPSDSLWLSVGFSFGFPLAPGQADRLLLARAGWDAHEWLPQYVPSKIDLGLELHTSAIAFRAEIDPIFSVSIEDDDTPQLFLQHAVEIQAGHAVGGGLRLQGAWLATLARENGYQLAFEPFFVVEHSMIFARAALVMPVTEPLGPAFEEFWGVKLATGIRLD
jgi:hypothetical protein